MNSARSVQETSCNKRQENGDEAANGSERPLKKARFPWQVKGKYHLKNEKADTTKTSTLPTSAPETASSSSTNQNSSINRDNEQKIEILGDYLLKDFKTLDSVIPNFDKSVPKPSTSDSIPENLTLPKINKSGFCTPIRNRKKPSYTEEQYIARWQIKQITKCNMENQINSTLELWNSLPFGRCTKSLALDLAEFFNNFPGDNSVENKGILMAISAHGLQNTSTSSSYNFNHYDEDNCFTSGNDNCAPLNLSLSPSDNDNHESNDTIEQFLMDDFSSNNLNMSWSYSNEHQNINNEIDSFSIFANNAIYEAHCLCDDNQQTTSSEYDTNVNVTDDHCDLLDEAILYAIQDKGLTTFGSDYG